MRQNVPGNHAETDEKLRIGAVSFFNARPLIFSLEDSPSVHLDRRAPAQLASALDQGLVHTALVPSIDYQTTPFDWTVLPVAAIGSNGAVLTVQVFSRCPLNQIDTLACDTDSHTSIILARIIWRHRFNRSLRIVPLPKNIDSAPAILLIGDKVLPQLDRWSYQLDLGEAWTQQTQLPFVYAFWALRDCTYIEPLYEILLRAYQQGIANLDQIIQRYAAQHGFDPPSARRYFTNNLCYEWDTPQQLGLRKFYQLAHELELIPKLRPLRIYSRAGADQPLPSTESDEIVYTNH
jgi:chorismate dehydratase